MTGKITHTCIHRYSLSVLKRIRGNRVFWLNAVSVGRQNLNLAGAKSRKKLNIPIELSEAIVIGSSTF